MSQWFIFSARGLPPSLTPPPYGWSHVKKPWVLAFVAFGLTVSTWWPVSRVCICRRNMVWVRDCVLQPWDVLEFSGKHPTVISNCSPDVLANHSVVLFRPHYATSRKVAGSIPDEVNGFFTWPNPSSRNMALGSTQPLTEMNTGNLPGGKTRLEREADNLTVICEPIV
jgi:hypothetical protein